MRSLRTEVPVPGAVIAGKYRVERVLGVGGMGVVVEATHVRLLRRVAVKMLRRERMLTEDGVARFLREARIAAQLQSEHVLRVTDIGHTEDELPFLVMELLDGQDLSTELARRKRLPIQDAVFLILEACAGLAEVHAAGLVHRDLKPANLFITKGTLGRPPVLKVLDFGLTKAPTPSEATLTHTAATLGTPRYMSPEQTQSARDVDARSDQHGLGVILYELLTGQPAYDAPTFSDFVSKLRRAPVPHARSIRRDVPRKLNAALVKAMAKSPSERFADVAEFARALVPFGGPLAAAKLVEIESGLSSGAHLLVPLEEGTMGGPDASAEAKAWRTPVANRPLPRAFWSSDDNSASSTELGGVEIVSSSTDESERATELMPTRQRARDARAVNKVAKMNAHGSPDDSDQEDTRLVANRAPRRPGAAADRGPGLRDGQVRGMGVAGGRPGKPTGREIRATRAEPARMDRRVPRAVVAALGVLAVALLVGCVFVLMYGRALGHGSRTPTPQAIARA